jgi:hypothetical protein
VALSLSRHFPRLCSFFNHATDEPEGTESEPDIDEDSVGEPESDEDGPSDDEPSDAGNKGAKGKGGFVLPVKLANKAAKSDDRSVSSASNAGVNLDSLSSGLMVKQPPKLLSKPKASDSAPAPAPPRAAVPKAASATGTRETAKAPASAALASATAHAAPAEPDTASLSTATGTAASAANASVPVVGGSTVTAGTVGGAAPAADLVLRDPEVVRAEALANVSMLAGIISCVRNALSIYYCMRERAVSGVIISNFLC